MARPSADRDPTGRERPPGRPAPDAGEPAPLDRERPPAEIPPRLVVVAYALALVCAVAPLAVLGAGFAGAVLFTRGRRGTGLGVIAVAVLCAALGVVLLR